MEDRLRPFKKLISPLLLFFLLLARSYVIGVFLMNLPVYCRDRRDENADWL